MQRFVKRLFLAGLIPVLMSGCGGGGGSGLGGGSQVQTAVAGVQITWGTRTRGIVGPGSALSAVVTFKSSAPNGSDVAFEIDRATPPGGYTQTYTCPTPVPSGIHVLQVVFDANAGGQGGVVAMASMSVLVTAAGVVENINGTALGNVQAVGNLATVAVVPGQSGAVNTPLSVAVAAADTSGNPVAITPGSATLHVVSGSASINSTGMLVGGSGGTVLVTATVDGVTSPSGSIAMTASTAGLRTLTQTTNHMRLNLVTGNLWASVPSTGGAYGNSVIEINPSSGSVLRSVFAGSEPSPLAFSDDGSTMFVGLEGASSICQIATVPGTVQSTFPVGSGAFGGAQGITDIAVQPGSTSTIAVSRYDQSDSGNSGPEIISAGTILPNSLGTYDGQSLAFISPTTLYALDNSDTSFQYFYCTVNSSGVTSPQGQWNVFSGFGTTIVYAGGRIYGSDGTILNATSGQLLGHFAVSNGNGVAVDTATNRAYFIEGNQYLGPLTIQSFDTNTFLPVAAFQLPSNASQSSLQDLFRYGATGLAFRSGTSVYFLDPAPGL